MKINLDKKVENKVFWTVSNVRANIQTCLKIWIAQKIDNL